MNSDSKRILSQFDPYQNFEDYPSYYSTERLWERLTQPTVLVSILVLVLTVHHRLVFSDGQSRPLPEIAWDGLVFLIPARLLYAIDTWLNPPLVPVPMLHTRPRTHAAKSEVLRKVLGMDKPGGIMMSVSQAGRKSLSIVGISSGAENERPAGLGNWDNSCYQNSILQSLAALKPLPAFLASLPPDRLAGWPKTTTVDTLRELVRDLNDESNNGKILWTPSVLKNMSTWQQQDAQEYFSKLLDVVDSEIAKVTKATQSATGFDNDPTKDDSTSSQHSDDSGYQSLSNQSKIAPEPKAIHNPLEGLAAQRVACTSCGFSEGLSLIPFNCLTLTLGAGMSEHDLYERLDSYTKVESIPGVDCPKCTLLKYRARLQTIIQRSRDAGTKDEDFPEPLARLRATEEALEEDDFDDKTLSKKCKIPSGQRVNSTKTKQAVIARPPQSLAVHMNRSVFDETTGAMFKNPSAVRFPKTLDLGPWCLGSANGPTPQAGELGASSPESYTPSPPTAEEQWLLDPEASMVAGDLQPSRITGPIYELRAVITHYGRHENGHYVCYRKHPRPTPDKPKLALDTEKPHWQDSERDAADDVVSVDGEAPADNDEAGVDAQEEPKPIRGVEEEPEFEPESEWWRLSDQDVTPVNEETVLAQGGVFMLFYDCVDPNYALLSDEDESSDGPIGTPLGELATGIETPKVTPQAPLPSTGLLEDDGEDILERARKAPLPAEGDNDGL